MQINEVLQPFLTKLEGKFTSMLLTGGTDIKEGECGGCTSVTCIRRPQVPIERR